MTEKSDKSDSLSRVYFTNGVLYAIQFPHISLAPQGTNWI